MADDEVIPDKVSTKADFRVGQKVRYVPYHAKGDTEHIDCEDGVVTAIKERSPHVWVAFTCGDTEECGDTGACCDADKLRPLDR
tara:strand:- start:2484 stop:2735 length:252 start_codon:yes stop_codon:yes gene_type:complete